MKRKFNLNLGCIIKVMLVLAFIMGGVFIFLNCSGGSCVQRIDNTLPDIQAAPWKVTTYSQLYFAKEAVKMALGVSMTGWFERLKGKWVRHPDTILLEYKIYGDITVERR